MIAGLYAVACILLVAAAVLVKLVPSVRTHFASFGEIFAALRQPDLTDDDKEKIARAGALTALGQFCGVIVRLSVTVAAAIAPVVIADRAGIARASDVLIFATRLDVLALTCLFGVALAWLVQRRQRV